MRRMFGHGFLEDNMGAAYQGESPEAAMAEWALAHCYGDVWTKSELTLRDRSLVTPGLLIALGSYGELANHVQGELSNGVSPNELIEVAPYVGLPCAGQALRVVEGVLQAREEASSGSDVKGAVA